MTRWLAVALLAGCGGSTSDVTLALTDDNGDCAAIFPEVQSVSIEIVATNGRCKLRHVCVDRVAELASLEDVVSALQNTPVLLEVPADDAEQVVINGRPKENCFVLADDANHPLLCGFGNIASADGGVLAIELDADGPNAACFESIDFCE